MAGWLVRERITDADAIKRFTGIGSAAGYRYSEADSDGDRLVFKRSLADRP